MEIRNTNILMPVPGIDQLPAGLEKQQGNIDQFNRHPPGEEKLVFIGYKPRYYDNTYRPYGKSRNNQITTGEIVDIYI